MLSADGSRASPESTPRKAGVQGAWEAGHPTRDRQNQSRGPQGRGAWCSPCCNSGTGGLIDSGLRAESEPTSGPLCPFSRILFRAKVGGGGLQEP